MTISRQMCWVLIAVVANFRATLRRGAQPASADESGGEHASLAQSAERFHGKEKVESSILSGGSPSELECSGAGNHGDVAQLVRALGS